MKTATATFNVGDWVRHRREWWTGDVIRLDSCNGWIVVRLLSGVVKYCNATELEKIPEKK